MPRDGSKPSAMSTASIGSEPRKGIASARSDLTACVGALSCNCALEESAAMELMSAWFPVSLEEDYSQVDSKARVTGGISILARDTQV